MTGKDLFDKMDRLRVTRGEMADRLKVFPHTLTDIKEDKIQLSESEMERLSRACDEIVTQRMEREEVVAA